MIFSQCGGCGELMLDICKYEGNLNYDYKNNILINRNTTFSLQVKNSGILENYLFHFKILS